MTKSQRPPPRHTKRRASPLIAALNLIGDGWTFLVLRELFFGVRRFEHMRSGLLIPRARLVERLQSLVQNGVVVRVPYQSNPPRDDYMLTEMGRDIYGMSLQKKLWADKWRKGRFPYLQLRHSVCGSVLKPVMVCKSCMVAVTAKKIQKVSDRAIAEEGVVANIRRSIPNDIFDRGPRREAVMETLKVMGDQRTIAILHEAFSGATRFEAFQTRTGIARNTLTLRLNHLVSEGVLSREQTQNGSARHQYHLTPQGWDLQLIEIALEQWARRWLFGAKPPAPSYRHTTCKALLETQMICKSCTGNIDPREVILPIKTITGNRAPNV